MPPYWSWVAIDTVDRLVCTRQTILEKCFDTAVISKGNEIHDVWRHQVHGRSLRLLEPFIRVVGFDYIITLKFQHFS